MNILYNNTKITLGTKFSDNRELLVSLKTSTVLKLNGSYMSKLSINKYKGDM